MLSNVLNVKTTVVISALKTESANHVKKKGKTMKNKLKQLNQKSKTQISMQCWSRLVSVSIMILSLEKRFTSICIQRKLTLVTDVLTMSLQSKYFKNSAIFHLSVLNFKIQIIILFL